MARVRHYFSYDEALAEWRRFGLPETFIDRKRLMGNIIVIEDDIGMAEAEGLVIAIKAQGGEAHVCRRSRTPKVVVVGSPQMYEQMSMSCDQDQDVLCGLSNAVHNYFSEHTASVPLGRRELRFDRPMVMGVLNVTPDSFSDGGRYDEKDAAIRRAREMVDQGADIIDIGAESTRPSAKEVTPSDELDRLMPVLQDLASTIKLPISVDTRHAYVAERALEAGASIINDVSGLRDEAMLKVVAEHEVPVIAMHMRGEPQSMQNDIRYDDLMGEIFTELKKALARATMAGIPAEKVILDPGIGFGKTAEQNLEILRRLKEVRSLGRPIMIGASRKAFIGAIAGGGPDERLEGSLAAAIIAVQNGANIVRVHDVEETVKALKVWKAVQTHNIRPY